LTNRERMEYDYLKKRDPMKEFFALVSVKIISLGFKISEDQ